MPAEVLSLSSIAVAGAVAAAAAAVSALLSCVPGLHIYNAMAGVFLWVYALGQHGIAVPPGLLAPAVAGLVVGYAVMNTVPSVLAAAPDESTVFTVLPGQRYLARGRGYEAVLLSACGSLAGLVLLLAAGPFVPRVVPLVRTVLAPHQHWVLWCVIAFLLMSEWPKTGFTGTAGPRRLAETWRTPGAGLLTFVLSAVLGFVLLYRSPVGLDAAFQNLMPAFVGLFALPSLLLNAIAAVDLPPQTLSTRPPAAPELTRGAFAGAVGGGFAALFPVVTGGIGGLLAGHAFSMRDSRAFLASQGASRSVYYAGGLLLFFVPGLSVTKGGAAGMLGSVYSPGTTAEYWLALGCIAVAGAVSILLASPLARLAVAVLRRTGLRTVSAAAGAAMAVLVWGMTGWGGLAVLAVSTAIGLIPILHGSRRINCLGVILLPMACNMSGCGGTVAARLGLL